MEKIKLKDDAEKSSNGPFTMRYGEFNRASRSVIEKLLIKHKSIYITGSYLPLKVTLAEFH